MFLRTLTLRWQQFVDFFLYQMLAQNLKQWTQVIRIIFSFLLVTVTFREEIIHPKAMFDQSH